MKNVLVTGGAGYIGSHTVHKLVNAGWFPIVVDNLSNGFREALPIDAIFYQVDVRKKADLKNVFAKHNISAVIHLAGLAIVEDSFLKSEDYLDNNYNGTKTVLELSRDFNVKSFIFSSSSTIYGDSNSAEKLTEKHNISVMSPYGKSKLLCEKTIEEYAGSFGINFINFRYFNIAGASLDLANGPRGSGSQRIFFNVTQAAVNGRQFVINGTDYQTQDGTCVRDYIHVEDIADIHVLGLKHLLFSGDVCRKTLNCGYGKGFSVAEIIASYKKCNQVEFEVGMGPRRIGDPAYLVGDSTELATLLGWRTQFPDPLEAICRSSYQWGRKLYSVN